MLVPTKLLVLLSYHGVHINPSDSHFSGGTLASYGRLEDTFYQHDIAILSTAFELKASKFNSKRSHVEGYVQVRESDSFKGLSTDPFPMHVMRIEVDSKSKSALESPGSKSLPKTVNDIGYSKLGEDEPFDGESNFESLECLDRLKEGSTSSVSPLVCLKPLSSNLVAMERVMNFSHLQTETVKQLLKLVRPLPSC